MSKKSNFSVNDWNALEVEKKEDLKDLYSRMTALNERYANMQITVGESGDKAIKKEMTTVDEERSNLKIEIEAVELFLSVIPKRRDLSKADELEIKIEGIKDMVGNELEEAARAIDQAAEELVSSINIYFDIQGRLSEINPHAFSRKPMGFLILNSLSVYLARYGLRNQINIGAFRGAQTMVEGLEKNPLRNQASALITAMQARASRLRGEDVSTPETCPVCFGTVRFSDAGNKKSCARCGVITEDESIQPLIGVSRDWIRF